MPRLKQTRQTYPTTIRPDLFRAFKVEADRMGYATYSLWIEEFILYWNKHKLPTPDQLKPEEVPDPKAERENANLRLDPKAYQTARVCMKELGYQYISHYFEVLIRYSLPVSAQQHAPLGLVRREFTSDRVLTIRDSVGQSLKILALKRGESSHGKLMEELIEVCVPAHVPDFEQLDERDQPVAIDKRNISRIKISEGAMKSLHDAAREHGYPHPGMLAEWLVRSGVRVLKEISGTNIQARKARLQGEN